MNEDEREIVAETEVKAVGKGKQLQEGAWPNGMWTVNRAGYRF